MKQEYDIMSAYSGWFRYTLEHVTDPSEIDIHLRHITICIKDDLDKGYIIKDSNEHAELREMYKTACKKKKELTK